MAKVPAPVIRPKQQKLLAIDIIRLKNLREVTLDFTHSPLTAIMGSNGSGKTTVLHALACAYMPLNHGDRDYHFSEFFRPNTDALWKESDFLIRYSQRLPPNEPQELSQRYTKATDRWTPRYQRRPERYTRFIGIAESVPDLETVSRHSIVHYTKVGNDDEVGILVRETAGQILNKVYESFYRITYTHSGKVSIGVRTPAVVSGGVIVAPEVTYSGLSMSSGEQRVFRILDAVFRSPSYSLILVDEIDLFLHQDALQKMIAKLHEHCTAKNKQLIFTTHFPPVALMYDKVCIYTLNRVPGRTVIWRGYSYEAMRHITGRQDRPVSCYVEDDVAEQIVFRVAAELRIRKFVEIGRYGPAINAFSLCVGLYLSGQPTDNTLAILDGDVYGSIAERVKQIAAVMTGNQPVHDEQRAGVIPMLRALTPPADVFDARGDLLAPEQMLHRMLVGLSDENIPPERAEMHEIAKGIVNVPEKHAFVDTIINHSGEPRGIALSNIVELASRSTDWAAYTQEIREWLEIKKRQMEL